MPTIPDPNRVSRSGRYPLVDRPPQAVTGWRMHTRAKWTGEFREPNAGEWFLSGAIVEAYYAGQDLSSKYHIAELVQGKSITVWVDEPTRATT